jgi:hypothetical protein
MAKYVEKLATEEMSFVVDDPLPNNPWCRDKEKSGDRAEKIQLHDIHGSPILSYPDAMICWTIVAECPKRSMGRLQASSVLQ